MFGKRRLYGVFCFILPLLVFFIALFVQEERTEIDPDVHLDTNEQPIILFWTLFISTKWPIDEGRRHCGEHSCYFTSNKKLFPKSSAVIFSKFAWGFLTDVLTAVNLKRPQWQRWILVSGESPVNRPIYHFLRNYPIFNWSISYRTDSDVKGVYGYTFPGKFQDGFDPYKNYLKGKTIEVSALISHCVYNRLKAVRSLMKYIDVNLMGACNGKWLSVSESRLQIQSSKFYLSFENSLCVDYITEKTYRNAYTNEAVPVILSGANLSNPLIVPPGSYIDASKFKTAKELADYLKYVGESEERYNKFFEWRASWNINTTNWDVLCKLCDKIHESSAAETKVYTDLSGLYSKERECKPYIRWN